MIDGFLRRLAEVNAISPERWADLEPVLQQLRVVNDKRNDILHYGAQAVGKGEGFVTNALMALTESRMRVFPISAPILCHMTFDCEKIVLHLIIDHMGLREAMPTLDPGHERILQDAWQYRPPPPNPSRSRPDATTKAPPPQR